MSKRPLEDISDFLEVHISTDKPLFAPEKVQVVSDKQKPSQEKNRPPVFKNKNFQHSNVVGTRKKPWRTLKQILAAETVLDWPEDAVTYSTLEGPPSFKPAKKYSDLSGVEALYTDPQTRLNYACPEEFAEIRKLPSDIVQGYLTLRKANTQLQ